METFLAVTIGIGLLFLKIADRRAFGIVMLGVLGLSLLVRVAG